MLSFPKNYVAAGIEYSSYTKHIRAPLFRKSITLEKKPQSAEILITGQGFYQLFVNGKDITKGFLAPYISNPDQVVYFDSYDLVPYLTEGENVIGVMLGDGMENAIVSVWAFDKAPFVSAPKFALSASIDDMTFEADSFVCTEGPYTFNNLRCGVHYDARLELDGWNKPGFDASDWRAPICAEKPRGMCKLCEAEPIAVRSEFYAVSITPGEVVIHENFSGFTNSKTDFPEGNPPYTGGYIYDFGKNSAGIFRLKIKNTTPGQKISLQCSEALSADGKLDYYNLNFYPDGYCQRDIYICRGGEEEIFVPQFTYHGYRYLYVHGIREDQATTDLLTYIEINTKLSKRASFECSDPMANTLYEICDNSDQSNIHYFPTDCPHREKNGWTGDAAASAEHMIMTLSVEKSWKEWLTNIRHAQDVNGYLPGIVPTTGWGFEWGNGPAWDRVLFDLPYYTYLYRGETEVIKENAPTMMRYLNLLTRKVDSYGLIQTWGLGDWSETDSHGTYGASVGFTNGCMIMDMCAKASVMFRAIGLTLQAEFAEEIGKRMKQAVRDRYIDFATMTVEGYHQTGQSMAIYYNVFEPAEKALAARVLVDIIHQDKDYIRFGYLGARVLFHVLSDYGYTDLAYKMITRPDAPSYGAFVVGGHTSMPENIIGELAITCSFNHHFFCDIKQWFIRQLVGINVNPTQKDPNDIVIKPHFIAALDHAKGSYDAPNGSIAVEWKKDGDKILFSVNTSGHIKYRILLENGYAFERSNVTYTMPKEQPIQEVIVKKTL